MKKRLIFLITILVITLISTNNVYATTTNFYEGEYINGIWMSKIKNGTKYYQTARFFREKGSNNFAYCIEPFAMFNENSTYESTILPYNLNNEQKERISLIAHFGYGYKNHTDAKWYAITQMMIWKESDPTGTYYFTDKLNGNKISLYENEMNEINVLINDYLTKPSIANQIYNIVENEELNIIDINNTLEYYKIIENLNDNIKITNNRLTIKNLKEGIYNIHLTRNDNIFNRPIIFYQGINTQNLVETGDIETNISFKIIVKKTELSITKIDSDTKTTIPTGEGHLDGAIYELIDENNNKITELIIDKDMHSKIENIKYGKYYLKEIKAGIGYELDNNQYEFTIDKDNNIIEMILENKIIKKEIELIKEYGDGIISTQEENVSFNIYDKNNTIVNTITTGKDGKVKITLPYGNYTIKQINSTPGYELAKDLKISVINNEKENYKLYDYKIKVPNTRTDDKNIIYLIIGLILVNAITYVKKRINN